VVTQRKYKYVTRKINIALRGAGEIFYKKFFLAYITVAVI